MESLLIAALAIWLFVSMLTQLTTWEGAPRLVHRLSDSIRGVDVLGIVPAWNFFAPNPGTTDYHLLYRDRLDSGEISDWREVPIDKEPSLLKAVWNPGKRKSKVLTDVISIVNESLNAARRRSLEQTSEELDQREAGDAPEADDEGGLEKRMQARATELFLQEIRWLPGSIPYLVILNYISNIPHPVFSSATQFLFAESRTYDRTAEPRVLYMSDFHNLP